jgi:hypothetical protein
MTYEDWDPGSGCPRMYMSGIWDDREGNEKILDLSDKYAVN